MFFGTNDASLGDQHVDVHKYEENLEEMIEKIRSYGIRLIVIGPALHEDIEHTRERSSEVNLQYSQAAQKVSNKLNVPFIDLWSAFARAVGWTHGTQYPSANLGSLMEDGIHYNKGGYEILYSEIMNAIKSAYPDSTPESMSLGFPPYADILHTPGGDYKRALEEWSPN